MYRQLILKDSQVAYEKWETHSTPTPSSLRASAITAEEETGTEGYTLPPTPLRRLPSTPTYWWLSPRAPRTSAKPHSPRRWPRTPPLSPMGPRQPRLGGRPAPDVPQDVDENDSSVDVLANALGSEAPTQPMAFLLDTERPGFSSKHSTSQDAASVLEQELIMLGFKFPQTPNFPPEDQDVPEDVEAIGEVEADFPKSRGRRTILRRVKQGLTRKIS
ncbi:hypothetical protein DFH06DRAFT_1375954 [Mycena polygramma]|nr:hypothetical protein DFH06DRAFT_1375954 [Mycena polygramma]